MNGQNKRRIRNQTVCFRMTLEERRELEARIIVSGMPKGEYFIQSLLHQELKITVGKYQSDRLSIEIHRLRECLDKLQYENQEMYEILLDCKYLIKQLIEITDNSQTINLITNDFRAPIHGDKKEKFL